MEENNKQTFIERVFKELFSSAQKDLKLTLLILTLIAWGVTLRLLIVEKGITAKNEKAFRQEMYEIIETMTGREVQKQLEPVKQIINESVDSLNTITKDIKNEKGN